MSEPHFARIVPADEVVAEGRAKAEAGAAKEKDADPRQTLERFRAETERLRVLVEFLGRPIHAHGGSEPDPDIVTAYNLAVEAALKGIRRASLGG